MRRLNILKSVSFLYLAGIVIILSGCAVTRVGAGVAYSGTKLTAKGLYQTGRTAYLLGSVPVNMTNRAVRANAEKLKLTYKVLDTLGNVVSITKLITANTISAELELLRTIPDVIEIVIDIADTAK